MSQATTRALLRQQERDAAPDAAPEQLVALFFCFGYG